MGVPNSVLHRGTVRGQRFYLRVGGLGQREGGRLQHLGQTSPDRINQGKYQGMDQKITRPQRKDRR